MENKHIKFNIGDYVLVNNKHIGYIVKNVWNSNGYIIKLEDNDDYLDKTLSQYKLLNIDNIYGYMLVTLNDLIVQINFDQIQNTIQNYDMSEINNLIKKINNKYDIFLKKLIDFKNMNLIII